MSKTLNSSTTEQVDDISAWVNDIHQGDAKEVLTHMPASSVHCVMTSPPYYGLRDYSVEGQIGLEETISEYIHELVQVFREVRRVLRPDGSVWLNLGDTFVSGSNNSSQNTVDSEQNQSQKMSLSESDNGFGSGILGEMGDIREKNKMLIPYRVAIALQHDGWILRNDVTWKKTNPRPQSVKDRLSTTTERIFHLTPHPDYWYDLDAIREPYAEGTHQRYNTGIDKNTERNQSPDVNNLTGKNPGDVFEASVESIPETHFAAYPTDICKKPIKASCPSKTCADCGSPYERETGYYCESCGGFRPDDVKQCPECGYRRTDWDEERTYRDQKRVDTSKAGRHAPRGTEKQGNDRVSRGFNPTCDCATESTRPGVVLDPFAGAGTTCLVGKNLKRQFVGVDINPEYVAIAQKRVGVDVDYPEELVDDTQTTLNGFDE